MKYGWIIKIDDSVVHPANALRHLANALDEGMETRLTDGDEMIHCSASGDCWIKMADGDTADHEAMETVVRMINCNYDTQIIKQSDEFARLPGANPNCTVNAQPTASENQATQPTGDLTAGFVNVANALRAKAGTILAPQGEDMYRCPLCGFVTSKESLRQASIPLEMLAHREDCPIRLASDTLSNYAEQRHQPANPDLFDTFKNLLIGGE